MNEKKCKIYEIEIEIEKMYVNKLKFSINFSGIYEIEK
jgi:hypothetical protein